MTVAHSTAAATHFFRVQSKGESTRQQSFVALTYAPFNFVLNLYVYIVVRSLENSKVGFDVFCLKID